MTSVCFDALPDYSRQCEYAFTRTVRANNSRQCETALRPAMSERTDPMPTWRRPLRSWRSCRRPKWPSRSGSCRWGGRSHKVGHTRDTSPNPVPQRYRSRCCTVTISIISIIIIIIISSLIYSWPNATVQKLGYMYTGYTIHSHNNSSNNNSSHIDWKICLLFVIVMMLAMLSRGQ